MGGSDPDNQPVHQVVFGAFAIGKTEITQSHWQSVMGNNPSSFKNCGSDCPVERVSWNDIQEFIARINARTGKEYRLPTEAEWEYACRGGGSDEFCGSSDLNQIGWYGGVSPNKGNSHGGTNPEARKSPNGYGLYDMSGNVWEWTQDCWKRNYAEAPKDGSFVSSLSCLQRVVRGGSWSSRIQNTRAVNRSVGSASFRDDSFGFRLVRRLTP